MAYAVQNAPRVFVHPRRVRILCLIPCYGSALAHGLILPCLSGCPAEASHAATSFVRAKRPRRFGSLKTSTGTVPLRIAIRSASSVRKPNAFLSGSPDISGPYNSSNCLSRSPNRLLGSFICFPRPLLVRSGSARSRQSRINKNCAR